MIMLHTLGALAFDNHIRGALVVITGLAVLVGSVWLIVSTNTGFRLGSLITLAGFFGWMLLMGLVWWLYGIGWRGIDPSWNLKDIVYNGDLDTAALESAGDLPDIEELPNAYALVLEQGNDLARAEFDRPVAEELLAGLDPDAAARLEAGQRVRNEQTTLGQVLAVQPELLESLDLGGWRLLSASDAGEPGNAASEMLIEQGVFSDVGEFLVRDAFSLGGKPRLPDDPTRWDRISLYVTNSLRIVHPTHYAIVQVQPAFTPEPVPGEAPPPAQYDEDQPVISVIMVRDLGNKRFRPAMVAIGSGIIFTVLCYMLHVRDKEVMRRRAAFAAGQR